MRVAPKDHPYEGIHAGIHRLVIEFTSTANITIAAWITVPSDGIVDCGIVSLHGYGGLTADDVHHPSLARTAVIWPCLRGMGELSRAPGLPSVGAEHVLVGIDSRDSYIHGGCVEDTWNAITVLTSLFPETAGRIDLIGASFGGGIGAMATAWDARIRSAVLEVPSFGNHPVRVTIPCIGSGRAIRELWTRQPTVLDVLAYFDAASCASYINVPVLVAPALDDPSVPPADQWSVYDALTGPKQLFTLTAGHSEYSGQQEEHDHFDAASLQFLTSRESDTSGMV